MRTFGTRYNSRLGMEFGGVWLGRTICNWLVWSVCDISGIVYKRYYSLIRVVRFRHPQLRGRWSAQFSCLGFLLIYSFLDKLSPQNVDAEDKEHIASHTNCWKASGKYDWKHRCGYFRQVRMQPGRFVPFEWFTCAQLSYVPRGTQ